MIDLKQIKKRYKPLLSSGNLTPIPLSKEDIFIPFKARTPRCKNDGAFGYINMKYIKNIKKSNKFSIIILDNDLKFNCLSTVPTARKHLRNGKIINRCYEERSMNIKEEKDSYILFNISNFDDMAMIKKRLEELNR